MPESQPEAKSELDRKSNADTAAGPAPEVNPHALPPNFVVILFAALAGGVGPGVFMTLIGSPGTRGSPLYGLLLPWTVIPFMLAVFAGWKARFMASSRWLAAITTLAAVGGLATYLYGLILHPRGAENTQLFFWVPAVQFLLLLRLTVRVLQSTRKPNGQG